MRLSEAIRLGSLLIETPEAYDTAVCAVGMALLAHDGRVVTEEGFIAPPRQVIPFAFMDSHSINYARLLAIWPWLKTAPQKCHMCGEKCDFDNSLEDFVWIVFHLFDEHVMRPDTRHKRMTIEQLADYIASIEPSPLIHAATENQPTAVNEGGDPGDEHVEPAQKVGR